MYKVLPQPLRSKICRHFPAVHQKQLERFLSVLTKYRNVCAHNDRLFTYRTVDQILDTSLHAKMALPKRGNQYMYGKQDLFAVVIAFRYLLPKENFKASNSSSGIGSRTSIFFCVLTMISPLLLMIHNTAS